MIRTSLLVLVAAAVALPTTAQPPKPRKVAFLVGVGKYKHLPDLGGAPQRDVDALEGVLKGHGFEVVKLTDADATKDAVEGRFGKLLAGDGDRAKALGRGDVLLVALCSHGFTLDVGGKPVPFVAGYDAVPNKADDMISLNGLIDAAKDYGAAKLFLVDACREETDANRGKTRGIEGTQVVLPPRTGVLFSCGRGQLSHQPDALKHGLFTFAVLKALDGRGGLTGEVTWSDLVSSVGKSFRSADFAKHIPAGREQTPVSAAGEGGDVPLLTLAGTPVKPPEPVPAASEDMAKGDLLPGEKWESFDYVVNDTEQKKGRCRVLTLDLGGGVTMDVVRITAKKFKMGSPPGEKERGTDEDQHDVTLTKDFYLGKFEVTQEQYKVFADESPSPRKEKNMPVEMITWDAATAYCNALGVAVKRKVTLPSEAHWEYACRAGTTTPFHFGSKLDGDHANHCEKPYGTEAKRKYHEKPTTGGTYKPNGFGLYDMHGNVWEYCQDYYGPYDKMAAKFDPLQLNKQAENRRVIRGGSWGGDAADCRAARRRSKEPDFPYDIYAGFRVCIPLD